MFKNIDKKFEEIGFIKQVYIKDTIRNKCYTRRFKLWVNK